MSSAAYWARRLGRHALLGALSLALVAGLALSLHSPQAAWRLSMGTAYAALVLLAASLLLGPWRVLRGRPNPVSTDLRRDVGIWAGVMGLLHVAFGLQVHLKGRWWLYFTYGPGGRHALPVRHDLFGAANWTGVAATAVLVLLLAISNDLSLARLGARRWKALQRWNYALAAAVLLHGAAYQLVEKRMWPFVWAFAAVSALGLAGQLAGWRRRRSQGERP